MKLIFLYILTFSLFVGNTAYGAAVKNNNFNGAITETIAIELTNTSTSGGEFSITWSSPVMPGNVQIDWGDGTTEEYAVSGIGGVIPHTFSAGSHTVNIFTGAEIFGDIYFNDNNIVSIDFRKELSRINMANFNDNPLTTVSNLSNLPELTDLSCANTSITDLDLSNNLKLLKISLINSPYLEMLTLPSNDVLEELTITNTKLTSLDISGKINLKTLRAASCGLTSIDLSGCSALTTVNVNGNKLTSLDLSASSGLQNLSCNNNELTSLILNPGISTMNECQCSNNKLDFNTLPRIIANTFIYSPQNIGELPISDGQYTVDLSAHCPTIAGGSYMVTWYANDIQYGEFYDIQSDIVDGFGISPNPINDSAAPVYTFDPNFVNGTHEALQTNWFGVQGLNPWYATISHSVYPKLIFNTTKVTLSSGTGVDPSEAGDPVVATQYYNLQGAKVSQPKSNGLYIVKQIHASNKVSVEKRMIKK